MPDILLYPQYCYYLRFHLLLSVLWLAIVYLSGPQRALAGMLGGVFHVQGRRLLIVSFTGTLLFFSLVATADLVFRYGPERFYTSALWGGDVNLFFVSLEQETLVFALLPFAAWAVLLFRLFRAGGAASYAPVLGGVCLTVGAAIVAIVNKGQLTIFHRLARLLFGWTPQGYFDPAQDYQLLHPGHLTAAGVFVVCLAAYSLAGFATGFRIKRRHKVLADSPGELPVPTLAWILSLLVVATWLLSSLAFFSDCFPYSVLVNLILLLVLLGRTISRFTKDPHTYRAFPKVQAGDPATAAEILAGRGRSRAIVVCASGGGIHAGAWAAAILDRLSEIAPGFREHVVLTSSVSGGSVGCFYFLASYGQTQPRTFPLAAATSLDYAAWGYAFGDLVRHFLPLGPLFGWGNRSWAIETAWRRFRDWDGAGSEPLNARLEQWEADAKAATRPAAVFNTTIVETGERFPIATVSLGEPAKSFARLYPRFTIRAATAANLSAAFPFVSPAARIWVHPQDAPSAPEPAYHLVDGGYYDNYGVLSALEFIESAFGTLGAQAPRVLILRIEGHPDQDRPPEKRVGFLFQSTAPLNAMFAMRSASQRSRNRFDLDLMRSRWTAASGRTDIIDEALFAYPELDAPLTWHLTDDDKAKIHRALENPAIAAQFAKVQDFLR